MLDQAAIDSMIQRYISAACKREKRENDVQYAFFIIEPYVLFAIKSKYGRVRHHVEDWMFKELLKHNMSFQLIYPGARDENWKCYDAAAFDLYPIDQGVDPNHSFDLVEIFGKKYTFRYLPGLVSPTDAKCSYLEYLNKLKAHGFNLHDEHEDWDLFLAAYKAVNGETPQETVKRNIEYWKGRGEV